MHYRRMVITYKADENSKLLTPMFNLITAAFNALGCVIVNTKDEPIDESEARK